MYGVILAGGEGTRLRPYTDYFSKSLYPIGNKFVIDFPIETLKKLGVDNLIVILGDKYHEQIVAYLKDGATFDMKVVFLYQALAQGIAHAINLAKNIIGDNNFFTILGDNLFSGDVSFDGIGNAGCGIVLREHPQIERFGVASVANGSIVKIQEKPKLEDLPSNLAHYAITGLYKFDGKYWDYFSRSVKSKRGEHEIVDIINHYHNDKDLGFSITEARWQDTGTFEGIEQARKNIMEHQ